MESVARYGKRGYIYAVARYGKRGYIYAARYGKRDHIYAKTRYGKRGYIYTDIPVHEQCTLFMVTLRRFFPRSP